MTRSEDAELIVVLKSSSASTQSFISAMDHALPHIRAYHLPPFTLEPLPNAIATLASRFDRLPAHVHLVFTSARAATIARDALAARPALWPRCWYIAYSTASALNLPDGAGRAIGRNASELATALLSHGVRHVLWVTGTRRRDELLSQLEPYCTVDLLELYAPRAETLAERWPSRAVYAALFSPAGVVSLVQEVALTEQLRGVVCVGETTAREAIARLPSTCIVRHALEPTPQSMAEALKSVHTSVCSLD